jgi:predicted nucleotidyltransferase component of viral defense system
VIPHDFITEWRAQAPWIDDGHVEQDLIISRAIVAIFAQPTLADSLAWRGGTALHMLWLRPAARYSEDIDLVQVRAEPIGDTLTLLRGVLDPWLGEPKRVFKEGRVNLIYRFASEGPPAVRQRLKIEINSREHFSEMGFVKIPFQVESRWFQGNAQVTSYTLDELLGTKLRALFQRKKGRDLFDLQDALQRGSVDPEAVVRCLRRYLLEGGHSISRAQMEENLDAKRHDSRFVSDIVPLLRPGTPWEPEEAMALVLEQIVARLPGAPWQGSGGSAG